MLKKNSDEITGLVETGERLVSAQRAVKDAIDRARIEVGLATVERDSARTDLAAALAGVKLGTATDADVTAAEQEMATAQKALDREELLLAGLRGRLIAAEVDRELADAESRLSAAVPTLAEQAVGRWRQEYDNAFRHLSKLLGEGSALGKVCNLPIVRDLINSSVAPELATAPLRHDPAVPVLEIAIPRMDPDTALSLLDERLARVVKTRNECNWARGLAVGERTRQAKEAWRERRAAGNGISRIARHPWPDPDRPTMRETQTPDFDPDVQVNQ